MTEKLSSLPKLSVVSVSICALSVSICAYVFNRPAKATTQQPVSYDITVSATIGEPKLTLFGYTSPLAKIKLEGVRVSEETTSNQLGYFFFDRIFLPRKYPELCLTSIDRQKRVAFPTCLPALPQGPFEITVGPVLLAPTLSLEKGQFLPGEQIAASGETIPNSRVTIFLANKNVSPNFFFLPLSYFFPSSAQASFLPQYEIQVKEEGHFQFNLPTNYPETWKVFAASYFLSSPTPKSNSLTFKVLSWWGWFWEKIKEVFMFVFAFMKPYLWMMIILVEIVVIGLTLIYWKNLRRYGQ